MEAGWYPDPFGRRRQRWWDGSVWTAYARDRDVEWDAEPLEERVDPGPGLPGIVVAAVAFVAGVGLAYLLPRLVEGDDVRAQLVSSAGLWASLTAACVYVSIRRGTGSLVRDMALRFRWIDVGLGLAGSLAGRILVAMAALPIPLPARRLRDLGQDLPDGSLDGGELLVFAAIVCIGAPLFEELFFRGLLQPRLVGRFGPVTGIAVTSLLFGAAHLIGWAGAISLVQAWAIAASGLVLGYLRHQTGRLGPAVLAHAFFNAQVVAVVVLVG